MELAGAPVTTLRITDYGWRTGRTPVAWVLTLGVAVVGWAAGPGGVVAVPEVSGAAFLEGGRLVVCHDGENGLAQFPRGAARAVEGRLEGRGESLTGLLRGRVATADLEDLASDGRGTVYAVASHARDRFGEPPDAHYRLLRLRFEGGRAVEAVATDALLQAIVNDVPFLADAIRRTPARTGLNIEGLALTPEGELLIGLRAPTVTESTPRPHGGQEDAVVLTLKNPADVFSGRKAELGEVVKVDLRGQGIRGMAWDAGRGGVWLVAGLSAEPTHPVASEWRLWFWDRKATPRAVPVPDAGPAQPEAVAVLPGPEGRGRLLLIAPGEKESRWSVVTPPD